MGRFWFIIIGIMCLVLMAGGIESAGLQTDSVLPGFIQSFEEASKIEYETDQQDYWQSPDETRSLGTGDCEDKALYLQQLLNECGVHSEVVFGVENNEESVKLHAWVECEIDGSLYVLDATNGFIGRRINMPKNSYMPVIGRPGVKEKLTGYIQRTGQTGINSYYEYLIHEQDRISEQLARNE